LKCIKFGLENCHPKLMKKGLMLRNWQAMYKLDIGVEKAITTLARSM
jgi:hypothetical protein